MQVSAKLRRGEKAYFWHCPACDQMHPLPDTWTFDGNLDQPTFSPSFKHSGMKLTIVDGKWTGGWERDDKGDPISEVCHYVVSAGQVQYCGDSTHALANQTIEMPNLPTEYCD